MKHLYVLFLFFAFHGFSQNPEEEILHAIPVGVKILEQKFNANYHARFTNFEFISLRDSITGQLKTVQNTGQMDTPTESFEPFDGVFRTYFSETTVPPLLDSLEDGTYAMFYTAFPYGDGDTLKFKTNGVYALIPVKNYQVNGTVSWYQPDGKLVQRSEYLNGEKHGFTTFILRNMATGQIIELEKKQYRSNIEDGPYYAEYHRDISKNPQVQNKKIFTCTSNKKNGLHHGEFKIHCENESVVSGEFAHGHPISRWIIKQWKIKGKKLVWIPNMEFDVNHDSVLVHSDFINRNLYAYEEILKNPAISYNTYPQKTVTNYANHLLRNIELASFVEEWNTDRFYIGKNDFGSIHKIRTYINCLDLLDKTNDDRLWNPQIGYAPILADSLGKSYSLGEVMQRCGIYYDFKKFTCYYPNGQLYFSFDFMDTGNIVQTPVYFENGAKLNEIVFSKKDGNYHYKEYDLDGTLLFENIYDTHRKFISSIDPAEIKVIDGDTLRSRQKSNWSFYRNLTSDDSTENRNFCLKKIIDYKSNKLIESHYYNPITKKGKTYELELETGVSRTTDYEYDTLLKQGILKETYCFNDLTINRTAKDNWNNGQIIYDVYFYGEFEKGSLLQNDKPFNGDFRVELSDKKGLKSSYSNGVYAVILNKENNSLFNSFLSCIQTNLCIGSDMDKELYNWVPDSVQKKINLKSISSTLRDGKAVDSIIKKSQTGYYLSKYYISSDSLVTFNNADQWLFGRTNVYYGNYEEEFSKNWISTIERSADSGKTHLKLNFNIIQDTTYYSYKNGLTGVEENYQKEDFKTTRWNSLQDTFLFYNSHNTYFGGSFQYDRAQQICREYSNKLISKEFLLKDDQVYQINRYDTSGILIHESFLKNGYLTHSTDYYNGQLAVSRTYLSSDSVIPYLDGLPPELDQQIVRYSLESEGSFYGFSPRDFIKPGQRENFTRYQDEQVLEKGTLVTRRKSGIWNYSYPMHPEFQLDFHDTSYYSDAENLYSTNSYTGTYTENKNGKAWKSGIFYEFNSEYNCGDNQYTEQYQIRYALWNGETTKGKSIRVINYYPNGNKMNEGLLVDGQPEGLWFWYHNDGLLYQAGKYHNGMREGRWMHGDLSKVHFTGESCLDPASKEYSEILQNIVVDIIYYKNGSITNRESHSLNVGK